MAKIKSKPLEIVVGKTYKNFKDYYRIVLSIIEENGVTKIEYDDGTGLPRVCEIDSFRQWVKRQYY